MIVSGIKSTSSILEASSASPLTGVISSSANNDRVLLLVDSKTKCDHSVDPLGVNSSKLNPEKENVILDRFVSPTILRGDTTAGGADRSAWDNNLLDLLFKDILYDLAQRLELLLVRLPLLLFLFTLGELQTFLCDGDGKYIWQFCIKTFYD